MKFYTVLNASYVHIEETKIVVYRDHLDVYSIDETGRVVKNRVPG